MSLDSVNTPVRSPTAKEYVAPANSLGPLLNGIRFEIAQTYSGGATASYQQDGYGANRFSSRANRIGRFPQLFPRITKPPAPLNQPRVFDISFTNQPTRNQVISRAENDYILIAPSVENIDTSNNKARFNIFKPVNLVYPRSNPATVPSNHGITDNIYNVDFNHLSNAGTNYV